MQPVASKAIIIFSSTVLFALLLFFVTSAQMNRQGTKAMQPYDQSQELINKYLDSLKRPGMLEEKYFHVFKTQQKILALRKSHHLQLGIIFFRNYYGVLILSMIFSCIGGIVLFLIANQGWANASITLKSLFLSLVLLVTFFGLFPTVFKQEQNFNENLKNYMSYTKAELNIVDQLSKLDNPLFAAKKDTSFKPAKWIIDTAEYYKQIDSMVTVNDNGINNLANYVLNIDAKEIKSMGDVYRMLNNNSMPRPDTIKPIR
jgi:predicted PurR-regulated permease PerM